jgi:hypothetical protein
MLVSYLDAACKTEFSKNLEMSVTLSRATAQAVSRRLHTAVSRVGA